MDISEAQAGKAQKGASEDRHRTKAEVGWQASRKSSLEKAMGDKIAAR